MSIFGDETITVPGSPDESGQDEGAAEAAGSEDTFEEDQDNGDDADLADEGDEQDNEQPEGDEQDTPPEGAGQGDLILGKFKSQNDLAQAYLNLQREFTKRNQQGGDQQPAAQMPVVHQPGAEQPNVNDVYWERFREDPFGTQVSLVEHLIKQHLAPIQQERQTNVVSNHLQEVAREYKQIQTEEGLVQLRGKVQEIADELGRPDLVDNPTPRILRMAAQEAFGDTKTQAFEKGKQIGRTEAERTRQSKQGLGAPNGARRQPAPELSEEDSIKAGILAAGRGGGLFG